ncbi:hypothetical protein ACFVRB_21930 [Streptomyces nojiriensis]|uniref:hypothetical protein n=1 Tax=Streptomyces nojiriensis TaxID=66374 RepID=UPI0036DF6E89
MTARSSRSKADRDPAGVAAAVRGRPVPYGAEWTATKPSWGLTADEAEHDRLPQGQG